MNSKTLAREMAAGCQHSQPIVIPCQDCIEKRIVGAMVEAKREYRDALKEQWDAMEKATVTAEREAGEARKQNEKVKATFERMRNEIIALKGQNKTAMETIADLKLTLHAEQASRMAARLQSGIDAAVDA